MARAKTKTVETATRHNQSARFGDVLRSYLQELNCKPYVFSKRIEKGKSVVDAWVSNTREPTVRNVGEIAIALLELARELGLDSKKTSRFGSGLVPIVNTLQAAARIEAAAEPQNLLWDKLKERAGSTDRPRITLGVMDLPPFVGSPARAKGFSLDVAERVFLWMNLEIVLAYCEKWEDLTERAISGDIDVIAPILFTAAGYLDNQLTLSEPVGLMITHVALLPAGTCERLKVKDRLDIEHFNSFRLVDFRDGRHAALQDYVQRTRDADSDIAISYRVDTLEEAVEMVEAGEQGGLYPCLLTASPTAHLYIRRGRRVEKALLPLKMDLPQSLRFGVRRNEPQILSSINSCLSDLLCSGVIDDLIAEYKKSVPELYKHPLVLPRQVPVRNGGE